MSSFRFEYCPAFITKHQRVVSKLILPAHPLKRIAQTTDHESSGDLRCSFEWRGVTRNRASTLILPWIIAAAASRMTESSTCRNHSSDCDGLRGSSYLQSRDGRQSWRLNRYERIVL